MVREDCPCKECTTETGRSPTCHSNCGKYTKWRSNLDEINAALRKKSDIEAISWKYRNRINH